MSYANAVVIERWILFSLLVIFANSATENDYEKRDVSQTSDVPADIARDSNFIRCLSENNCGLQNKCSFKIQMPKKIRTPLPSAPSHPSNSPSPTPGSTETPRTIETNEEFVSGHVLVVKNGMNYPILYYWDILGQENPNVDEEAISEELFKSTDHSGLIYAEAHSTKWIDTGYYDSHTIRLFVANERKKNNETQFDFVSEIEPVETLISSDEECTYAQTCRLLLNVCYLSTDREKCEVYASACNNFKDDDDVAKQMCIPECVYTYYADVITTMEDIDSDVVVEWISRGGGVRGSGVDGSCNTAPVIVLVVLLIVALAIIVTLLCLAKGYKGTLVNADHDYGYEQKYGDNDSDY